ncbi:IclR family transcriptional regulator [Paramixta manurensis]|uniref:HTH-type transcriptional repressor AllR n=1 Tax=Paramixta manurensis TaxID=2740817 RepID=A0A6M8UJA6_9GAMM|nr:IclR family transcriptional regulator [Erwiniaceae bacterium PD-1]
MSALNTALNLLKAFTPEKPSWGVRELSQWSGISSSTVQRVLATYCSQGLMQQNAVTRRYEIGIGFWQYGMLFRQHLRLDTLIAETVKNLADQSGETAYCSMPDGETAICVQLTESRQDIVIAIRNGERTPLHLGSRGKAILAWLPEARRQAVIAELVTDPTKRLTLEAQLSQLRQCGWILSRGERLPNVTGISVPLLKASGEIFASLTIGGPSDRMSEQKVAACLPLLQQAKTQLEFTLSHLD